jgi:hypothetical protein
MTFRDWATGGMRVGLFVRVQAEDVGRVGHCWMRGRLIVGDLAMAIAHSGDGFWNYQLVQSGFYFGEGRYAGRRGYALIEQSEFGAYAMGIPFEYQPNGPEIHLLLAGEHIALSAEPKS